MPIATPQGTLDFKSVDTITFVGASSNTVIDTTTGSLGVGVDGNGPTSNLHVVGHTRLEGDINMLHTSNTASIKLNSNVVTEFPRSKKLIKYPRVAMTGNDNSSTSGYVAEQTNTASHGNADAYAYRLFDNTSGAYQSGLAYSGGNPTASAPTTTASDGSTHQGVTITLDLVTKIRLDHTVITSHANYGRTPVDGTFLGSNNSSTWDVIQTFSGLSTSGDNQKHTIHIINSSQKLAYRYIRFVIKKIHTSSVFNGGGLAEFRELEFYGTPEYDPEADGVDVVVKSVPNVPNTDWLEVYYDAKNYSGSGDVQDESGNDRDAEMNATFDNGEIKAFNFTGAHTSNVTTSDHGLGTGDVTYTVSYWFKRTRVRNTYDYLYIMGNGLSTGQASLMWITGGKLHIDHWSTASKYNEPIQNNRWYHVAAGHKGGDAVTNDFLFIDGQNVGVALSAPATFNLQGSKLTLGTSHNSTNEFLEGSIANFRLFNRALTSDEIYQLYAYQKEYFGHGDLSMTLKAGRLGIGTSEPRAALDVRGDIHATGSLNPVAGMWTQSIDSSAVTTTIITNIGSCMSTKAADGYGGYVGFTGNAGIFVAPYDGIYQFQFFVLGQNPNSNLLLVFNANGPSVTDGTWNGKNIIGDYKEILDLRNVTNVEEVLGFSTLLNMSKDDTVDIQNHSTGYLGDNLVRCSCFLVHRT